jgi:multicomponent K+:H+ antiporter subunit G
MTVALLDWLVAGLLVLGGTFGLIGSYGLLRLQQMMQRLHAPTKAATLGLAAVLAASALWAWVEQDRIPGKELLITFLIFITAPLSAFYLAKVHLARGAPEPDLPQTGTGSAWATLAPDRADDHT